MPSSAFRERFARSDPRTRRDLLHARFRHNRDEFLRYCLPGIFNQPWNAFHEAVLRGPKQHWADLKVKTRTLNLAPRGVGKSTLRKGDVAHSVVYGLRRFVIVVAATRPDAKGWAATLIHWFEKRHDDNAILWDLFGPFEVTGEKQRVTIHCPGGRKTTILCASVNTSLQGENELTHRPDEVILDDWEDRKKVKSATIRAEWQRKLNEEILKLGDRTRGMAVEANVTINHPDAISARIRRREEPNRGWTVHEHPAILHWPERVDLWEECRGYYLDLELGEHARDAALAFYEANRAEMDRGAEVLDPVAQPLFALYEMIWCEGLAAFMREMQHRTRSGDSLFDSERFARCKVMRDPVDDWVIITASGRRIPRRDWRRTIARWDPCQGVPGGDNAAIVVLVRDQFGYGYVVDGWRRCAKPSEQLAAAWALAEKWGLDSISLESNGFQALIDEVFRPQREARREAGQFWQLRLELDPSTTNKEDRLASLEAPCTGRILQFAEDLPPEGLHEFDEFDGEPDSHKDDFHDAVEGAWSRSGGAPPQMSQHPLAKASVAA